MAFTAKVLADGQLPSSKGTLYTVPGATATYIRQIRVFSTGSAQTVVIYFNTSGSSRRYGQWVLETNESADVLTEPLLLQAGDLIEGQSTSATTVDYVVTGVEEA
jgi:hypothetical protein